jgi:hypothetical protein
MCSSIHQQCCPKEFKTTSFGDPCNGNFGDLNKHSSGFRERLFSRLLFEPRNMVNLSSSLFLDFQFWKIKVKK